MKQQDPQVRLESAIAEAINEFERQSSQMVIGVSITREGNEYLQVGTLILPKVRRGSKRLTKMAVGLIERSRKVSS